MSVAKNSPLGNKVYIAAVSHRTFLGYCHAKGINPRTAVYLNSKHQICGIRGIEVILVYGWWKHFDKADFLRCDIVTKEDSF